MTSTSSTIEETRPLVVLVGKESDSRRGLARELIDDGSAVVLCAGPPDCPLLRGQPCALLETADGVVVLPTAAKDKRVVTGLLQCAEEARTAFVMDRTTIGEPTGALHVGISTAARAAAFVGSVLRHPSMFGRQPHRARSKEVSR